MALLMQEMAPVHPRTAHGRFAPALASSLADWKSSPSPTRAAEVLSAALASESDDLVVRQIANSVREQGLTGPLRALANEVLARKEALPEFNEEVESHFSYEEDAVAAQHLIHELRVRTRAWPKNAFTWIDLGRAYFAQGMDIQALRAIDVALALDPDNRFVVRSSSRFFQQLGDEDRARHVLSRAIGSQDDPWLMSVGVALGVGARRNSLRHGQQLLEGGSVAPWHVSELGAALASREDEHGATRVARRLMTRALVDPTENVLAHAEWASHLVRPELTSAGPQSRAPHEALARRSAKRQEWAAAAFHSWRWHRDEPFSALAAGTGSAYAIYAGNFDQAEYMTTAGLKAHPSDSTLLNNRAFARACQWRLAEAIEDFKSIDLKAADTNSASCAVATAGFIAFRADEPDLGRRLYELAVRRFQRQGDRDLVAMALLNLASEEVRSGTDFASAALQRAKEHASFVDAPEVAAAWARLEQALPLGAPQPDDTRVLNAALAIPLQQFDDASIEHELP